MAFSFFENLNFSKHRMMKTEIIFSPLFAKSTFRDTAHYQDSKLDYSLLIIIFQTSKN